VGRATGILLAACLAMAAARPAAAQPDFFLHDNDDSSVYRIWPLVDGSIIAGATALTIGFYGFGSGIISPSCPCNPQSVNGFDRPTIGNHSDLAYDLATAAVGLSIFVPIGLDVWDLQRFWPLLEDVTVLAESVSLSVAFFTLAKFTAQRPFPRTYAGDPGLIATSGGYRSFYSGHTAITFTALGVASMTIGRRYGHYLLPWIATTLVGSAVAAGVVLSGWHFPTDSIAGALIGSAIGVAVPVIHFSEVPVRPTIGLAPDGSGPMLSLAGTWF